MSSAIRMIFRFALSSDRSTVSSDVIGCGVAEYAVVVACLGSDLVSFTESEQTTHGWWLRVSVTQTKPKTRVTGATATAAAG